MSKKIKKVCLTFALAAVVGVSAAASACTVRSKHPNARITIEFNSETYEIDFTLYRNMYPQTVQHFIELADSGFYNDTIVHDYKSTDWVTGGYSYDDDEASGYVNSYAATLHEYLENHSKEHAYYELMNEGIKDGRFTASVYTTTIFNDKREEIVSVDNALPTLIGEFSENGHKIEDNKGLTSSFGTLKMMYYKKDIKPVFVKNSFDQILPRDYNYNCATSLFSLQVSNSSQYEASKYCVFGQLRNDGARNNLEDLTDAISDYASTLGETSKFSKTVDTKVDREDVFADESGREIDVEFKMTSMPLIIRRVEITKY